MHEHLYEELARRKEKIMKMGGDKAVDKQHKKGMLWPGLSPACL